LLQEGMVMLFQEEKYYIMWNQKVTHAEQISFEAERDIKQKFTPVNLSS